MRWQCVASSGKNQLWQEVCSLHHLHHQLLAPLVCLNSVTTQCSSCQVFLTCMAAAHFMQCYTQHASLPQACMHMYCCPGHVPHRLVSTCFPTETIQAWVSHCVLPGVAVAVCNMISKLSRRSPWQCKGIGSGAAAVAHALFMRPSCLLLLYHTIIIQLLWVFETNAKFSVFCGVTIMVAGPGCWAGGLWSGIRVRGHRGS